MEISLYGYSPKDADSVAIKIQRNDQIIASYKDTIPKKFSDSLRLRRDYTIDMNILLTDTLMVKIADKPTKKLYGFSYEVQPQLSMMDRNYGCRFNSFIENGKIMKDYRIVFTKKKSA